jgi:hypothetical protein
MDAAFEAAGVIRCRDLDELLETVELIDGAHRTRRRVGRGRTGLVTVSTGEASLVSDLAEAAGFPLPPVPDDARSSILEALPTMGVVANPVDPWGAADAPVAYAAAFEALAGSGGTTSSAWSTTSPTAPQASELDRLESLAPLLAVTARPAGHPADPRLADLGRAAAGGSRRLDAWPAGAPRRSSGRDRASSRSRCRLVGGATGGASIGRGRPATRHLAGAGRRSARLRLGSAVAVSRRRRWRRRRRNRARPARAREPGEARGRGIPPSTPPVTDPDGRDRRALGGRWR